MPGHDLICVGASAGGVEALLRLVPALPADLPAAVLIAMHFAPRSASNLPALLAARGALEAHFARDGETPEPGVIHVARPDRHLVVEDGALRLSRGPHENGHRPAVDSLFRSAALSWGPRVVGVVLSGLLDDGTVGLTSVRRAGGVAVVQDPRDAAFPGMPRNAIRGAGADHIVTVDEMAPLLARLAAEPVEPGASPNVPARADHSPFACPDCGGVLDFESLSPSFQCQVGHRWNAKSLASKQAEVLEMALWAALRALVEHARLSRTLEARALKGGSLKTARRFAERARESEKRLELVRAALGLVGPSAEAAKVRGESGEEEPNEPSPIDGGNGPQKG